MLSLLRWPEYSLTAGWTLLCSAACSGPTTQEGDEATLSVKIEAKHIVEYLSLLLIP